MAMGLLSLPAGTPHVAPGTLTRWLQANTQFCTPIFLGIKTKLPGNLSWPALAGMTLWMGEECLLGGGSQPQEMLPRRAREPSLGRAVPAPPTSRALAGAGFY